MRFSFSVLSGMTYIFALLIIVLIIAWWILFCGAIFYIIYFVLQHIGLIGVLASL